MNELQAITLNNRGQYYTILTNGEFIAYIWNILLFIFLNYAKNYGHNSDMKQHNTKYKLLREGNNLIAFYH